MVTAMGVGPNLDGPYDHDGSVARPVPVAVLTADQVGAGASAGLVWSFDVSICGASM
jgi:hypothetical protein